MIDSLEPAVVSPRFHAGEAPPRAARWDEVRDRDEAAEIAYLRDRVGWLIRLRWLAVAGVLASITVAAGLGAVADPRPLFSITAGMALCNAACWAHWRQLPSATEPGSLRSAVFLQIVVDVLILTLLLHWSGGLENPFSMFYVFHMALGAMLLPPRRAILLGLITSALYGGMGLAELRGWIAHHSLSPPLVLAGEDWMTPVHVGGHVLAFAIVQLGTLYFVYSIAERHRYSESMRREHERIAQSRERLARVGEIAAGVAHAVRNPLHGLLSSVEILQGRHRSDSPTIELLGLMREALRRIEGITQRLLLLTREAPIRRVPVDIDTLVLEALRLVSPSSRGSAATLEADVRGSGIAEVDPDRLSEILSHVVDNALDACRDGGRVVVRTAHTPCWIDHVRIEVEDEGEGIPPDCLRKVFDPFFTTKAIGEGSGLGLSITRRVVEEHGGQVWVESEPGVGSKVVVHLPRRGCLEGNGRWTA